MATEITEAGYQSVRDHIDSNASQPAQWDYIELRDSDGNAVTRVSVTGDSRSNWTHSSGDQVLEIEFEVQGGDSDIGGSDGSNLPVTVSGSASYDTDSDGSALAEDTFFDAQLSETEDQLLVRHRIEVPQTA